MGQESDVAVSCGVGLRRGLDLGCMWLGGTLEVVPQISPLTWKIQKAEGQPQKKKKKKKKKKKVGLHNLGCPVICWFITWILIHNNVYKLLCKW